MLIPNGPPTLVGSTVQATYRHVTHTTRGGVVQLLDVIVDLDAIATLAPRALSSERGEATLYFRAITVKVQR